MRGATVFTVLALVSLLGLAALLPDAEKPPDNGPLFSFADREIDESSGLVALGPGTGDLVVTVNDSGDEARVFVVDPATGETVGTTRWDAEVEDVEALAPVGPVDEAEEVWVADIGDNYRRRDEVVLHRVPVGRGDRSLAADEVPTYRLVYPDGARDAEALLAHPRTGRLLVVSKALLGGHVYQAPRRLSSEAPNELTRVRKAPGMVTGGAFSPDGRSLVLRSYSDGYVYRHPGLALVGDFPLPPQRQGESLAVAADGTLLVSTEGRRSDVLALQLPADLAAAVRETSPGPEDPSAGPAVTAAQEPWWQRRVPAGPLGTASMAVVLAAGAVAVGGLVLLVLVVRSRLRSRGRPSSRGA